MAQRPPARRGDSRLMLLDGGRVEHSHFDRLGEQLLPGDLLVINTSRVLPARMEAHRTTGGRVEILLERVLSPQRIRAQLRNAPAPGARLLLGPAGAPVAEAAVVERRGIFFTLDTAGDWCAILEQCGSTPLPPYLRRAADGDDRERYQTLYAREPGSVAAPTAGLHFADGTLARLERRGVGVARLHLHIGAGTWSPVREADISRHRMHPEWMRVDEELCRAHRRTRRDGGRVVAVGTTVARALESAFADGALRPFAGDTSLFVRPGYRFRALDMLLTNFHLPRSSLLMLVCAFAGMPAVLAAYGQAVAAGYRFHSYGDAMLAHLDCDARAA